MSQNQSINNGLRDTQEKKQNLNQWSLSGAAISSTWEAKESQAPSQIF